MKFVSPFDLSVCHEILGLNGSNPKVGLSSKQAVCKLLMLRSKLSPICTQLAHNQVKHVTNALN